MQASFHTCLSVHTSPIHMSSHKHLSAHTSSHTRVFPYTSFRTRVFPYTHPSKHIFPCASSSTHVFPYTYPPKHVFPHTFAPIHTFPLTCPPVIHFHCRGCPQHRSEDPSRNLAQSKWLPQLFRVIDLHLANPPRACRTRSPACTCTWCRSASLGLIDGFRRRAVLGFDQTGRLG